MSKTFKCMCLLVMSVFCMSSISPSLVVFADDSLSANSKVVSGEAQFENGSSVRFGDTQVNILSDEVLEVVNPDGSVDTIERRADGVYINGAFYMAYQKNEIDLNISFRSYDPNVWNYVNTIHGNKQANTFANFMTGAGISYMIGRIGALLGGPWGAIIGGAYFGIQAYQSYLDSQSPYPYYITSTYIHVAQRKWKFIAEYYRNSDYTGYVKTVTTYVNF
ncbi:Uncharacterised protein [Streptococcus pneumoniae]|nr:Uncharacterised protein [Streptococcus pneumoniae]CKI57119.1 Uncharacterised protein [Streptococcus pneumoniae]CMY74386.1 Uncharacterised protein [Streptococcus pneumoniae]VIY15610.1 Uncharacterised protein [Streptococcus pneumoniae]VKI91487.1 Uncharacterised protein [Streptococcus pneumoniae]